MTPREKQIFEKDIQRHLDEMNGEAEYSHLSGEEAYELAVEKAETGINIPFRSMTSRSCAK